MKNKFIIDTPDLQSLKLKYSSALITLIFWIIWFYLWIPVITLLGWYFQIDLFQQIMISMNGLQGLLDELPVFTAYVIGMVSSLALWSVYNYFRFRGLDRRKPLPVVTRMDLLDKFPISDDCLTILQEGKITSVGWDEDQAIYAKVIK